MAFFNRRRGFAGNRLLTILVVSMMAGGSLLSLPHTVHAASFNCDAQTLQPDEKVICDTRSLNDADVKMATTFDLLSGLLAMGSRGSLQDEQTAWLKKRQACAADAACIKGAYDERLKQLDETYKKINRPL